MDNKIVAILISIFLPPLAVYLKTNEFGKDFIINVILCFIMFFPAIIHALWISLK